MTSAGTSSGGAGTSTPSAAHLPTARTQQPPGASTGSSASAGVPAPATPQVEFRVLYLFAGRPRKADLKDCLVMHGKDKRFKVIVEEVDITRSASQDLSNGDYFNQQLIRIRSGRYDLVMVTPPCSSWSRAQYKPGKGPRPMRSRRHPWGSHGLTACARPS